MNSIQQFSFSVNNWQHLYSLQQAIAHNQQLTGSSLSIRGKLINQAFFQKNSTDITLEFSMLDIPPEYPLLSNKTHQLGLLKCSAEKSHSNIMVDKSVFEELRKNLMEYADIEGIHIVVSMGLLSDDSICENEKDYAIVQLDYAMKGDS